MVKTHVVEKEVIRAHLLAQPIVSFTIISDPISRICRNSGVLSMAQSCIRADGESRRSGALLEQTFGSDKVCNRRRFAKCKQGQEEGDRQASWLNYTSDIAF